MAAFIVLTPDGQLVAAREGPEVPATGQVHALIVFARFSEDTEIYRGSPPNQRAWADPDRLPDFAEQLLSGTPDPPFDERTLTAYYFRQSQHQLVLYGTTYPEVVVAGREDDYSAPNRFNINLGRLSRDILQQVNADPAFDLADFDANEDGYVDYVFVIVRSLQKTARFFRGASGFSSLMLTSPYPEFGRDGAHLKKIHQDLGAYIRYNASGVVIPEMDLARLMAHEFGHNVWSGFSAGHLRPLLGSDGVPDGHPSRLGYALMVGTLGGNVPGTEPEDVRGDYTISAVERDLLGQGWISCTRLDADRDNVRISDLYASHSGNCYTLALPDEPGHERTLYLSNRQRMGFFDRPHTDPGLPSYTAGLQTTGLLAAATRSEPFYNDPRYAVVAADNTLALNDSAFTYEGDLFGPDTKVQLTPWTRPNIAAYTSFPADLQIADAHFQAIDRIRYSGAPDGEMAFDYVRDFRERPVIRENSWMGRETEGYTFTADVVVASGATLTIETNLTVAGALRVEAGSTVIVRGQVTLEASAVLEMAAGAEITGPGVLVAEGAVLAVNPGASLTVEVITDHAATHRGPDGAPAGSFRLAQNYPNPFNPATTIAYDIGRPGNVTLTVYDALGRHVRTLVSGREPAGTHEVVFDADTLPSGTYLYRLVAGDFVETRSLILAK